MTKHWPKLSFSSNRTTGSRGRNLKYWGRWGQTRPGHWHARGCSVSKNNSGHAEARKRRKGMEVYAGIKQILGLELEPKDLTFLQISLRGIIVFIVSLTMIRFGARRFLAKMSAFDAILGFYFGFDACSRRQWLLRLFS